MQPSALRPVRRITPTTIAKSPDTLDALPGGWDFDGCAEEIRKRTDPRAPSMLHVSDDDFALALDTDDEEGNSAEADLPPMRIANSPGGR